MTTLPDVGGPWLRPAVRTPVAAIALAAVVLLLLAMLGGLLVMQGYRDAVNRADDGARTAAHTVSAHVQWLMEASRQALRRVDERLGDDVTARSTGVAADLNAAVDALPGQVILRVFDADGTLTNSSEAVRPVKTIATTDYFAALKAGREWVVTKLMTDAVTGEKVFAVGRRLQRNGQFAGVALLVVPAAIMEDFWSSLSLGPGSSVSVFGDDGWLVARWPVPDAAVDLSNRELFTDHLPRASAGAFHFVSDRDNGERIVGYRRVEGAPLVALASVPTETAMEAFHRQLGRGAALVAPVLLVLAGFALWVSRLLQRDEETRLELAGAVARNHLLFREIHHRVKNNLQAVSSMVRLQPISAEAKDEMRRRIDAMAAVHEHIYNSDQFASVNAGEYIRKLAKSLDASRAGNASVTAEAEPVAIEPEDAMSLGLIVNEVVSNALKHAFPDGRAGTVRIGFRTERGKAVLAIRDDGIGFDRETPATGMGLKLINGLAARLGGEYRFEHDEGTAFDLTFPLRSHHPAP